MTTAPLPNAADIEAANRRYFVAQQLALSDFQFIEESIRFFLIAVYAYVRFQIKEKLPFGYDYSDVENDALGRLIQKYSKFSKNTALVGRLRGYLKQRNEIAHRGLVLTVEEMRNIEYLNAQSDRLEALHRELKPCIQELLNERADLTGEAKVVI